jgi:RNA polymerase sigma factor (sigma-70 family)
MTDLVDRESSSHTLFPVVPSTSPHPSARDAEIERDYADHRSSVLAMLRADFPRLRDAEEFYNEAWAELLELEARGETVRHRRALLKKIAWRRAADATKRRRPETMDPSSAAMVAATDDELLPDEQAQLRLDGEALRLVVESLDERQAAILKLRFDRHLSAREIQGRFGISEKRLEAIVTEAYKKIAAQLAVGDDGETRWTQRQRSLLLACELGIASARQRRRAQSMVDRDPACRAMLRAMRSSLDDVAAVLPMPVLIEERERLGAVGRATSRLDEAWLAVRHLADRVTGRTIPSTNLAEQVGAGGATAGAGAAAAKVVAACLAVGGTATLCVSGGPSDAEHHPIKHATTTAHRAIVEPARDHVVIARLPKTKAKKTPTKKAKTTVHHETAVSSPKSAPPPSPAPQGSTEFGPGDLGSSSAPKQPAAAPEDGGGEFTP